MADPREFSNKEFQKEFKETVSVLKDTMVGLSASMGEAMSNAMTQSTDAVEKRAIGLVKNDLAAAFRVVGTEVDKINETNKKFIKGQSTVAQLQKKRAEIEAKFEKLDRARNEALKYGVDLSAEQEDNYNKAAEAVQVFTKKQEDAAEALTSKLGGLVGLMDRITNIPIVGQLLNAGKASAAMKEELIESGDSIAAFGKGISAAFKGIEKSTIIIAAINAAIKAVTFFKDLAFGASDQITKLARSLGTSLDSARKLRAEFFEVSKYTQGTLVTMGRMIEATGQLTNAFGFIRDNSNATLKAQILLTERIGASAEQASFLNLIFAATGKNAYQATEEMNKLVVSMQEADGVGISIKTVTQDIAEAGADTASYFGNSATALTKAVIETRKLGLNLAQAKNIAGGLLDFESSITAQLELSALTQKQFNFGQAMAYSAVGEFGKATKIVMGQLEKLTDEQRKSPVILQAAAKAAGLSTEELAKAFALQKDINAQRTEYGRIRAEQGEAAALQFLKERGLKAAEFTEIENRISASERFNQALDAAKEAFSTLVSGGLLDRLIMALEKAVDWLEKWFGGPSINTLNRQISSANLSSDVEVKAVAAQAEKDKKKLQEELNNKITESSNKNSFLQLIDVVGENLKNPSAFLTAGMPAGRLTAPGMSDYEKKMAKLTEDTVNTLKELNKKADTPPTTTLNGHAVNAVLNGSKHKMRSLTANPGGQ